LVTHWAAQLGTPRLALQVLAEAHPATLTNNQVAAHSGFEQYADAFTADPGRHWRCDSTAPTASRLIPAAGGRRAGPPAHAREDMCALRHERAYKARQLHGRTGRVSGYVIAFRVV